MKTREILKIMLFLAGIVLLSAACNKKDDQPKLDFNITVPDNWNYYIWNADNIVYYASSPLENANDSITEDILITKDPITGKDLGQFSTALIASLDDDTTYHPLYYSADTTINGATCRKLLHLQTLYTIKQPGFDTIPLHAKLTKYIFVRNNFGYIVSMNALVSSYPVYRPIFDTIISSFAFKN